MDQNIVAVSFFDAGMEPADRIDIRGEFEIRLLVTFIHIEAADTE